MFLLASSISKSFLLHAAMSDDIVSVSVAEDLLVSSPQNAVSWLLPNWFSHHSSLTLIVLKAKRRKLSPDEADDVWLDEACKADKKGDNLINQVLE